MASERGVLVAKTILSDLDREGHFKTAEMLRLYLVGHDLPGTLKHEETTPVASAILARRWPRSLPSLDRTNPRFRDRTQRGMSGTSVPFFSARQRWTSHTQWEPKSSLNLSHLTLPKAVRNASACGTPSQSSRK